MNPVLLLAAAAAQSVPGRADDPDEHILVTAAREPVAARNSTMPVVAPRGEVDWASAIDLPTVADAIRGTPGFAVAVSGPRGSQTQIRIRGAEANHTLLFVDGIRFNDPAAGNEARFELLTVDGLGGIDLIRGPASALWGSEAIGGIVAVNTRWAAGARGRVRGTSEYGSLDSPRISAQALTTRGDVELVATGGWMRSDGIDSFSGEGDRDGFENRLASVNAIVRPATGIELGAVGHWVEGESEYDGLDPATFRRADTLDSTRNRIGAARAWVRTDRGGWIATVETSLLDSANRNLLAGDPLNRTAGRRFTMSAQLSRQTDKHLITFAAEHQAERFRARDQVFLGATDQDRARNLEAGVAEWRADWAPWLTTDVALRHDSFSAFRDATTVRAAAIARANERLSFTAVYGEGIAQPTFYDLYGFFPGSFVGNPSLGPERSVEWNAGISWRDGRDLTLGLYGFTARLRDEIVDVFDPVTLRSTTANAAGASRRRGIEAQAEIRLSRAARFSFYYTYLDAEERESAGGLAVREPRRPRHSAMLSGFGETGRLIWGVSLVYTGERRDTDFDGFPARAVVLDDYVLGSARLAWRISPRLEAYVRAENALDATYQDVVGYRTAGRTIYAGVRLRDRD